MTVDRSDVVVVGAGLAGMRAALAAEEAGAQVALVDRGAIGTGTNSALSNAAFSGPASPDSAETYVRLVVEIGKGLNRLSRVRQVAQDAPAAIRFLQSLGLEIAAGTGSWLVRSPRPEVIPGIPLVRRVAELVSKRSGIRIERGLRVTALLRGARRILGVRGTDLRGQERELLAPAVILACGGAGALYPKHDNQATILGQGYYLAARAGLRLWDMEFVQFYPLILDEPGWPMMMLYPPLPTEARLVGAAGEDLVQKHELGDINRAIVQRRDSFSALLLAEAETGPVCMDLTRVPDERWGRHPMSLLRRFKATCRERPIRVTPAAHFCMGGVRTNAEGETDLPGLFACGEVVWGLHGANRMGGNALMECLVSGVIVGRAAAASARVAGDPGQPLPAEHPTAAGAASLTLPALRKRIQETAWRFAGVVRSAEGMTRGLAEAEAIFAALAALDPHTLKDRILREDLLSAAFTLRAILTAGLPRQESRGAFIRRDYLDQDDARWRKNSCLAWDPATDRFTVSHSPSEADGK